MLPFQRLGGVFCCAFAALWLRLSCALAAPLLFLWRAVGALLARHVGALLDDFIHTLRRMFLQVTRYGMTILVRSLYH